MDRNVSTEEMLPDSHPSHLGDVSVPGQLQLSTAIPIREEFRCRRWWFFYHDLRAFTTSVSKDLFVYFVFSWLACNLLALARASFCCCFYTFQKLAVSVFAGNGGSPLLLFTTSIISFLCLNFFCHSSISIYPTHPLPFMGVQINSLVLCS